MKYPVSVWLDYFYMIPVEEAIARMAKAGFTHGELSILHLAQLMEQGSPETVGKALRQCADSHGYTIPQGHLSFKGGLVDDSALERLKPELDMFAAAGIGKAILHTNGGANLTGLERYERWVHYTGLLAEYVDGTGVTLCVENMYSNPFFSTAQQIKKFLADAGSKNLAICLDTGHLHLCNANDRPKKQSHYDFITEAGDLLQALHIVDNNGLGDTHQMPYSARTGVDWQEVMRGLRDIDYKGLFNLEILGECRAPMPILEAKLPYIRAMCEYMLSDEFLA